MIDRTRILRALSTRGSHATSYNPAAQYMPRPENTLIARLAKMNEPEPSYKFGSIPGLGTFNRSPSSATGQQKPGFMNLLGPVIAPNLTAKLGAKGG